MRRHIQGLHEADPTANVLLPDSLYLVRVVRAQYRWHPDKPYYILCLVVLEPQHFAKRYITGRIYCTRRALWKLNWFLRDFGYDTDLLGHDEIDEKSLVGLQGVVKIGHVVVNGTSFVNLEGFAPASQWQDLSPAVAVVSPPTSAGSEVA
ncbi:MAG TPA: hypothetical protein VEH30_09445 [Terriglobales bacterium]|nr:hypothetical protein [Terriglobales bacterium]